jgi:hypothetical protein
MAKIDSQKDFQVKELFSTEGIVKSTADYLSLV